MVMEFRKLLIKTIGIYLAIAAGFLIILITLGFDINRRVNQIAEVKDKVNLWSTGSESLATLKRDSGQARLYMNDLQGALPSHDQLLKFYPDLNIIARQNKVNLELGLGREEPGEAGNASATNFSLQAQGLFDNLTEFLAMLRNSRYPINFSSLDLTQVEKSNYKMSINGKVFSF